MILFDGRITLLVPALFPIGCCTYFSFTHVTTCAFRSDHQFNGITRMLGMAASAAGAPDRMSEDCTQSAGIDRAKEDVTCAGIPFAPGFTCVNGIPRSLSCCSTLVYATLALLSRSGWALQASTRQDYLPAVCVQLADNLCFQFETRK